MIMNKDELKYVAPWIIGFIGVILFVVFSQMSAPKEPTSPIDGSIRVTNSDIHKVCDGADLIYSSGGVVLNSPQCKP